MQLMDRPRTEDLPLVQAARALHDTFAARREQTERERRVPTESIEAMKEAGLFRALQSTHFQGLETSPEEFFAACVEVSAACPSTGWVLGILGVHPFEFAHLTVEAQQELYDDDPNTLISSSYAPQGQATRVPGGYRLTGRWRSSSGVDHATWVVLGSNDPDDDGGERHQFVRRTRTYIIPQPDYSVIDDWYVMGLAGTGSKSVVLDDVFVPDHRSLRSIDVLMLNTPGLKLNTAPLFRLPRPAIYSGAGAAPAIGAAKGAYQEFLRQINGYVRRADGKNKATDPIVQLHIANAQSLINNAEQRVLGDYREMYERVCAGEELTTQLRARAMWSFAQAANDCVRAVREIFETRGASAVYNHNPLQSFYRDVVVMRQHGTQERDTRAQVVAQAELGLLPPGAWI